MIKATILLTIFVLCESCTINVTFAVNNDCPTEQVTIIAFVLPPYVIRINSTTYRGIAYDFIKKGLEKCFSHCEMEPVRWTFVNNTMDLQEVVTNRSTDIAFPIVSCIEYELEENDDLSAGNNTQFVFEDLIESPGLSFVIHTGNFNDNARMHTLASLLEVWPIVVFCLLLAGTSGIFVWALEYRVNRSQFPKNFFNGSYEGFWWAFVTMTTVGYGDKTPKSVCGRMFGVLWILIGLVIIAMLTAGATNSLAAGITYYESGIHGKHVGVLKFSEAGHIAVKKGASIKVYDSFERIQEDLDGNILDGLLIDRYEAAFLLNKWQKDEFRVLNTIDKDISYKMVRVYGRNKALGTNRCFQERIRRHGRLTQKLVNFYIKPIRAFNIAEHSVGIFSSRAHSTVIAAAVLGGTFICLIIMGSVYQFVYRNLGLSRKKSYKVEDDMFDMHAVMLEELGESVKTLSDDLEKLRSKLQKLDGKHELRKTNTNLESNHQNSRRKP